MISDKLPELVKKFRLKQLKTLRLIKLLFGIS
jgi:hypothetical protein